MDCPYRALGVSKACTPAEIKRAYKEKVKKTHPDATGRTSDCEFIRVKQAYMEILSMLSRDRDSDSTDSMESIPYMTVSLSNATDLVCRCGTVYADTDRIGTVECMCCSHYIEIVADPAPE